MKGRRYILLGPLLLFQAYLTGTLLLFASGPWNWHVPNPLTLYSFLLGTQCAILTGYLLALVGTGDMTPAGSVPRFGMKWFRVTLVVSTLLAMPTAYARTGSYIPDILSGIVNPGDVYIANVSRLGEGGIYVLFEYIRILFSIFIIPLYGLSVLYWRSLSTPEKVASCAIIAFNLAIYIAAGQNKGLADLIATLAFLMIAGQVAHRVGLVRTMITASVALVVGLAAFFTYFGMTQLLRRGGAVAGQPGSFGWSTSLPGTYEAAQEAGATAALENGEELSAAGKVVTESLSMDPGAMGATEGTLTAMPPADPGAITAYPDHLVAQFAPDFVRNVYESFARYLGQGYQALALSFDLEHPLTWGFGNSMFLARNADRALGTDFFVSQSLPGILQSETGWSMFNLWHSIYPWIASDVGFLGTLIVMGVLGFLLARAWINTIATLDPLWGSLLYLLLILFFYIPGNNQLMQSGETASAFVILLGLISLRALYRKFGRKRIERREPEAEHYPPG
jgi:hypothetical protein